MSSDLLPICIVVASRSLHHPILAVAKECCAAGAADAHGCVGNVSDAASCRQLIEFTLERYRYLDILVNNGGVSQVCKFEDVKECHFDDMEHLFRVNTVGAMFCTHAALSHLKSISRTRCRSVFSARFKRVSKQHCLLYEEACVAGILRCIQNGTNPSNVDVLVVSQGPIASNIHQRRLIADERVNAHIQRGESISVHECAALSVEAMFHRERQVVMAFNGKLLRRIQLVAPGWADRLVIRAVDKFDKSK
eukprot:ANDGO_04733.mRNA.1 Versicolorin reductase